MSNESKTKTSIKEFASFKCVIFDWDGTIVDSVSSIVDAVYFVADQMQLPRLDSAYIRKGIGLSPNEQILRLYGNDVDLVRFKSLFESFYYNNVSKKDSNEVFTGVEHLMHSLFNQGYILAIATGKSRSGLNCSLDFLGWSKMFEITCCAEEHLSKPSPAMVNHIVSCAGVGLHEVLVIGDSYLDLEMANNANVASVGVLSGTSSVEDLSQLNPLKILDSAANLKGFLVNNW